MSRPAQSKIIRAPLCSLNVPFKPFLLSRFRREDFWGMSLSLLKRKEKVGKKAFSLSVILNNYVLIIETIESTNEMISNLFVNLNTILTSARGRLMKSKISENILRKCFSGFNGFR